MPEGRRVVVTGMGVVSPLGSDVASFWSHAVTGCNGIRKITRFDTSSYKATLAAEVKGFEPEDYMSRSEIIRSDLFTRYAIGAAAQAVEESKIIGTLPPERIGVYLGSGIGGIETLCNEASKLERLGPRRVSSLMVPMMIANIASGAIAIRYRCKGPAMPAVTACASGANAIGEAMRLIRHGYADAVIAGGAEAPIVPVSIAAFINMKALSTSSDPDAASLPFDARRAGFVIGEGAGVLVLEEYAHARKRNAPIYGEVCGYGSTCDAYHMTAPHPRAEGATQAMKQALDEAGYVEGESVYINAHGTGTPMNDVVETMAIKKALGAAAAENALISSTKSMTGHMLGAAGAIEAIACLKTLETKLVAPTINLVEQDPKCNLNYVPGDASMAQVDLCLSNSLGFGGHNACLAFRKTGLSRN